MKRHEDEEISNELSPEAVQNQVERILGSEKFARSKRLRSLLRFTVQQTLQGHADTLKEYVIGTEVLKKPDSYDPRRDSLVRVLASRLRVKLKEYYNNGGSEDPLVIEFPKGKYVPRFQRREQLQTEMEKKLRARNASSQGKFLLTRLSEQTLAEAAHLFEEAIEADPSWPAAHEGLAMVCAIQGFLGLRRPREVWPQARAQAEAVLHLDEMSAEAQLVLGMYSAFYEWRWREAESHFHKAIERDLYAGGGRLWRALGSLLPLGKTAEAQQEVAKARELAPAPFLDEGCALALYLSGQYEQALSWEQRGWAGRPAPAFTAWLRGCALAELGRTDEALEILQRAHGEAPRDARLAAALAHLYGIAGQADRGREILKSLEARREQGEWIANSTLAAAYAGLGDSPQALAAIHDALRDREAWAVYLQLDPRLRPLHDNPKFAGLVRRVFLAENEGGPEQNETPNLVERRSGA